MPDDFKKALEPYREKSAAGRRNAVVHPSRSDARGCRVDAKKLEAAQVVWRHVCRPSNQLRACPSGSRASA